jgi:hypothetical protein
MYGTPGAARQFFPSLIQRLPAQHEPLAKRYRVFHTAHPFLPFVDIWKDILLIIPSQGYVIGFVR